MKNIIKIVGVSIIALSAIFSLAVSNASAQVTTINPPCTNFAVNLQVGSTGPDVTVLQNFLVNKGFYVSVTGYFGTDTYAALAKYQTSVGLPATGYFGPLTRAQVNADCINPPLQAIASANVTAGTLQLAIDTTGKEVSLSAPFAVQVTAGSNDITFSDSGSFDVAYIGKGTQQNVSIVIMYINKQPALFPYILKAGQSAEFYLIATAEPLKMFAGYYSMSLTGIHAVRNISKEGEIFTINSNNTNSVVIIGEKSPYISSVIPNTISSGQKMSIEGARLIGAMGIGNLYIDNLPSTVPVDGSKDGMTLFFTLPALANGWHSLYVRDNVTGTGESNRIGFEVIGSNNGNLPPVISGGTFPVSLAEGETGTWTVNASDPENGPLSYSVDWGDTYSCPVGYTCTTPIAARAIVQTSTFTHSYSTAGTYKVVFTVQDNSGQSVQTSATVQVGTSVTPFPITVISPQANSVYTYNSNGINIPVSWNSKGDASSQPDGYQIMLHALSPSSGMEVGRVSSGAASTFNIVPVAGLKEFIASSQMQCPAGYTCTNAMNYYVTVNALKNDRAGQAVVATADSGKFVINYSSTTTPPVSNLIYWTPADPAAADSVEGQLSAQGSTWVEMKGIITAGSYVKDIILPGRANQPKGRGAIAKVDEVRTETATGKSYAVVDFGRGYVIGLYLNELALVKIISPLNKLTAKTAEIINGQTIYAAGQVIKFSVKGITSEDKAGDPFKGFNVQAYMQIETGSPKETVQIGGVYQSFNATYNQNTSMWDVLMTAPSDTSKTYKIGSSFYCSNSTLGCSNGQIDKSFIFNINSTSTPSCILTPTISGSGPTYNVVLGLKTANTNAIRFNLYRIDESGTETEIDSHLKSSELADSVLAGTYTYKVTGTSGTPICTAKISIIKPAPPVVTQVSVLPWTTTTNNATIGQPFNYTLNWSGGPMNAPWNIFVHLIKSDTGAGFSAGDIVPNPTTDKWTGNISTNGSFTVPAGTLPGTYKVMVGLYNGNQRVNTLKDGRGVVQDDQFRHQVGTITIYSASTTPSCSLIASVSGTGPTYNVSLGIKTANTNAIRFNLYRIDANGTETQVDSHLRSGELADSVSVGTYTYRVEGTSGTPVCTTKVIITPPTYNATTSSASILDAIGSFFSKLYGFQ